MWHELASPLCSNTLVRPNSSMQHFTALNYSPWRSGGLVSDGCEGSFSTEKRGPSISMLFASKKEAEIVKCFQVSKYLLVSGKDILHCTALFVEIQRHVLKGYPQTAGCIKKSHQLLCFSGRRWS